MTLLKTFSWILSALWMKREEKGKKEAGVGSTLYHYLENWMIQFSPPTETSSHATFPCNPGIAF